MTKALKIFRYTAGTIFVLNLLILFLSNDLFVSKSLTKHDEIGFKEKYNKELFEKIKSIKQLNNHLHKKARNRNISKNDLAFLNLASDIVKERFYYDGYSFYESSENIILYYLGRYAWDDFAAIVIPDDILKKEHAACSQQAIVLMELLKKNNIPIRKIGLKRHFALEAKFKGNWYFFDPTFELKFDKKRTSFNNISKNKALQYYCYKNSLTKKEIDYMFENFSYGRTNHFPASKMLVLHELTFFYLDYLLFISLLMLALIIISSKFTAIKIKPR